MTIKVLLRGIRYWDDAHDLMEEMGMSATNLKSLWYLEPH